mmetsp:Transcript_25471/g.85557  ORF Transcript_25471/g.85557 Transcript_25471/m.85557 type:complete len:212 (+) Transcript_25471:244-879(+)
MWRTRSYPQGSRSTSAPHAAAAAARGTWQSCATRRTAPTLPITTIIRWRTRLQRCRFSRSSTPKSDYWKSASLPTGQTQQKAAVPIRRPMRCVATTFRKTATIGIRSESKSARKPPSSSATAQPPQRRRQTRTFGGSSSAGRCTRRTWSGGTPPLTPRTCSSSASRTFSASTPPLQRWIASQPSSRSLRSTLAASSAASSTPATRTPATAP